jgi:hypothetical protein
MTNNNLTTADIARIAASLRTANFNPTKGRTTPRTTTTKRNNR